MCGIVGLIVKNDSGERWGPYLPAAANALNLRGPDAQNFFREDKVGFGHCRLSIIDLSEAANQPMYDVSNRYVIIYNGEIFNFKELRKELEQDGAPFKTNSDTEVLMQLYHKHGKKMLQLLNGFFAFAIYDREEKSCFIARDRFGVKPLVYYEDDSRIVFASELKSLMQFPIPKKMDESSLYLYLQLNYIPAPDTIYDNVKHLLPGHFLFYQNGKATIENYYSLPEAVKGKKKIENYDEAKKQLFDLMDDAVQRRLISDVPLGAFLSGGIDSSIVCGLASRHTDLLKTYSIGYKDDDFFDETNYARLVAKHFKTEHTVFSLSRNDLLDSLNDALNYFDQPFADSSALPVYVLSKHTRRHVKVSLSGDGADEIFGGYIKHQGEFRARNPQFSEKIISSLSPLWKLAPRSRNNSAGNFFRRLQKFSEGAKMNPADRYWRWCSIGDEEEAKHILNRQPDAREFLQRKRELTKFIGQSHDMNDVLMNDVHLVLPNDMLVKVDCMSMANGLEVRTPFLDYRVVEFAFSIPSSFKIDRQYRKKIVHDAFKDFLPIELYHRPKRGFEIPLHSFLTKELKSSVEENLSESFIREQNIFNDAAVTNLKAQLFSKNPGDSAARVWAVLAFQHWWKQWIH